MIIESLLISLIIILAYVALMVYAIHGSDA